MSIKEDFAAFQDEVVDLIRVYRTFQTLFGDESTRTLLGQISPGFFNDVGAWMKEVYYLRVGRISDPATSLGRSNLSTHHIVRVLKDEGFDATTAQYFANEIGKYREKINLARNRFIAHNDVEAFRARLPLGEHDLADIDAFLLCLQQFVEAVVAAIGRGPSDYWLKAAEPRVGDLLEHLKGCVQPK